MSLFRRRAMSDQEKSADLVNIPYVVVTDATPFATVTLEAGKTYSITGTAHPNVLSMVDGASTKRIRMYAGDTRLLHITVDTTGRYQERWMSTTLSPTVNTVLNCHIEASNCTHETEIIGFIIKEV